MLRRVVLAYAGMMALTSSVYASDVYVAAGPGGYKDAPVLFSWTGFYVGLNGGFGVASRSTTFRGNDIVTKTINCEFGPLPNSTCPSPIKSDLDGGVAGGQVGYNWQFNQRFVLGVEADFDASDIRGKGTSRFVNFLILSDAANFQSSEDLKWFGTVKGRFGFAPTERSLLFISGGLAYGQVHQTMAANFADNSKVNGGGFGFTCGPTGGAGCFLGSNSQLAVGYTVGGGLEIAVTNNITVKTEYSYLNLGDSGATNVSAQSIALQPLGTAPASFTAPSSKLDYHVVRFGVSFKTD